MLCKAVELVFGSSGENIADWLFAGGGEGNDRFEDDIAIFAERADEGGIGEDIGLHIAIDEGIIEIEPERGKHICFTLKIAIIFADDSGEIFFEIEFLQNSLGEYSAFISCKDKRFALFFEA